MIMMLTLEQMQSRTRISRGGRITPLDRKRTKCQEAGGRWDVNSASCDPIPQGISVWGNRVRNASPGGQSLEGNAKILRAMRETLLESPTERVPGMARWYRHPADYGNLPLADRIQWDTDTLATAAAQLATDEIPPHVLETLAHQTIQTFEERVDERIAWLRDLRRRQRATDTPSFAPCRDNADSQKCALRWPECQWQPHRQRCGLSWNLDEVWSLIERTCASGDRQRLVQLVTALQDEGFPPAESSPWNFAQRALTANDGRLCRLALMGFAFLRRAAQSPPDWLDAISAIWQQSSDPALRFTLSVIFDQMERTLSDHWNLPAVGLRASIDLLDPLFDQLDGLLSSQRTAQPVTAALRGR